VARPWHARVPGRAGERNMSAARSRKPSTQDKLRAAGQLRAGTPHSDTRTLLRRAARFGGLSERVSVTEARRNLQLMMPLLASFPRVALAETRSIPTSQGSVWVRVVVPVRAREPRPAIVWFHGGGFVLGDLSTAEPTARSLALRTGAIVVCVGYRKAPEHSLDEAYQDGLDVLRWVRANAASLGADRDHIAVGGDSAGGNIAAVVAQEYQASPERGLAAQLLVYPAVAQVSDPFPSKEENLDDGALDRKAIRWFQTHIAGSQTPGSARYAPLGTKDLSALPATVIITAGFDPLRDEGLAYYDRIRQARVPATLLHYPDEIHGFFTMDAVLANGRAALEAAGRAMAGILGSSPVSPGSAITAPLTHVTTRARDRAYRAAGLAAFVGSHMLRSQLRYHRCLLELSGLLAAGAFALADQVNRLMCGCVLCATSAADPAGEREAP
jgi:acetyl esterase